MKPKTTEEIQNVLNQIILILDVLAIRGAIPDKKLLKMLDDVKKLNNP